MRVHQSFGISVCATKLYNSGWITEIQLGSSQNAGCTKTVSLHTSRVPKLICKQRCQTSQFFDDTRRSWPNFSLLTQYQRGHSKSPFTPLIPKLNLMKILSWRNSGNTSKLLAPGSLKEFARHLIPAKPVFRGIGNRSSSIVAVQSTVTPRWYSICLDSS